MSSRLEANKKRNEETILAAAFQSFSEKGFEATTISDIVKASKLARGTFYNYYKNKDEIWDKLIEKAMITINGRLVSERQSASNMYDFVYNSFLSVAWIFQENTYLRFIVNNQSVLRKTLLSSQFLNSIYVDLENDLVNSGFYSGLPPKQLRMISYSFMGTAIELTFQSYMNNDETTPEDRADFFTHLFIGGYKQLTNQFNNE